MGLFSFIGDAIGDITGSNKATKYAKKMGAQQMERENAFMDELGGLYNPAMDAGNAASQRINSYYSGDQQPMIDMATSSPMYSALQSQGENAIARNAQATGGLRSGTTQQNLAENSQDVLMQQINQLLQGNQYIAGQGANAANAYAQGKSNVLGQIGNTSGGMANVGIGAAGSNASMLGGIAQGVGTLLASDGALKENIVKIGEKNGLNWYKWDWNESANEIGLHGSDVGHIAQEVEAIRPDLVGMKNGYKAVNYEGF